MRRIFSLISILFVSSIFSSSVFSATGSTSGTSENINLEMKNLKVIDSRTVRILFSDDMDATSVVLKVAKQSDNSSINIADAKGTTDAPDSIDVILEDDMEEGTSYTMTVLAAVGVSGSTISDGANALKEFVTPSPLKKANVTLNAPTNPNAAIIKDDTPPSKTVEIIAPKDDTESEEPVPTEELPLTGMNPFIFLLAAFSLSYFLLRKKSV